MARSALLVIDMQNDFVLPDGPMYVAGGAGIVKAVERAVEIARSNGDFVVWVIREHHASGIDVENFRKHLYDGVTGPTCKGEHGAALVDGLVPQPGEYIQLKYRFSAFFSTNLDLVLRRAGVSHLIIAGVQTPNCIRATVFDALALDYSVTVLSDATAAATPEIHEANLRDMRNVSVVTRTVEGWSTSA